MFVFHDFFDTWLSVLETNHTAAFPVHFDFTLAVTKFYSSNIPVDIGQI